MGPRSFDRGKVGLLASMVGAVETLQWGRGHSTAESRHKTTMLANVNRASMGPRSFDRGKSAVCFQPFIQPDASMGPRSFDRGKFQR